MTHPTPNPGDQSMVAAFPMPTSTALAKAYQNLVDASSGTVEVRNALGNPALLPRPWIPASCTGRKLRAELWTWLDRVVIWLNEQYVWDPAAGMIPSCWPQHPHLVNEIAVLADQRRRAAIDLTSSSLEEWHRYCLPNFHARVHSRIRNGCDEKHTAWPAGPRHNRHLRNHIARQDTFNADLNLLAAQPPLPPEPDEHDDAEMVWQLRLATDHGEIVDPGSGDG